MAALAIFLKGPPRKIGLFFVYGLAYAREGKATEAAEYFEKAAQAYENDPVAWGSQGIALCEVGSYEAAIESLERALALDPANKEFLHYRCEALFETGQFSMAVQTAAPEDLAHNVFHQLLKIHNSYPKQGELQRRLEELLVAHASEAWKSAFRGGLTEFASFASEQTDFKDLEVWNQALQELFPRAEGFSILLKLFDVLTRFKVFGDTKALLGLPREQRLLLVGEKEDSLGTG